MTSTILSRSRASKLTTIIGTVFYPVIFPIRFARLKYLEHRLRLIIAKATEIKSISEFKAAFGDNAVQLPGQTILTAEAFEAIRADFCGSTNQADGELKKDWNRFAQDETQLFQFAESLEKPLQTDNSWLFYYRGCILLVSETGGDIVTIAGCVEPTRWDMAIGIDRQKGFQLIPRITYTSHSSEASIYDHV